MYEKEESYQKLFLRRYPLTLLRCNLQPLLDKGNGEDVQRQILEQTVCLPLVREYPLKLEYMLSFLKYMISELEDRKVDICDELYEIYCSLMNTSSKDQKTHYRHFMIDDTIDNIITIEESNAQISEGTTGLCTWQASQALVGWCTLHKNTLKDKCVIELGSGVGMAGLSIINTCEPKSYFFSDCHPSVLTLLKSNIKINVERVQNLKLNKKSDDCRYLDSFATKHLKDNILFYDKLKSTSVGILNMRWEDVKQLNIRNSICPDVVVAADVVYDSNSFHSLCEAFCHLIQGNCIGILACAIRNEDTMNEFLNLLGQQRLIVQMCKSEELFEVINPSETSLRVYHISRVT